MRLSATSHLVRTWALAALYAVLILPRHVREFRRWFARMQDARPPYPFMGYVHALFMAVDDVTRLTTSSAGWEAEMLRLLHYCGPTLTHLSLWQTESRALLRDAGQATGTRFAKHTLPAWAVGEGDLFYDGPGTESSEDDDLPGWLRAELASAPLHHVARAHPAHFSLHARTAPAMRRRLRPRACTPTHLSLVISYPFFENERPELFAGLVIWTCVQELDVYITQETRRSLHLLALLGHRPIRRLRVSTAHATVAIEVQAGAGGDAGPPSAPSLLHILLHEIPIERALLHAFSGRGMADPSILRAACLRTLAGRSPADGSAGADEISALEAALHIRLCITQGGQAVWGKLRHRLWDFRERAQFGRDGAWTQLLGST